MIDQSKEIKLPDIETADQGDGGLSFDTAETYIAALAGAEIVDGFVLGKSVEYVHAEIELMMEYCTHLKSIIMQSGLDNTGVINMVENTSIQLAEQLRQNARSQTTPKFLASLKTPPNTNETKSNSAIIVQLRVLQALRKANTAEETPISVLKRIYKSLSSLNIEKSVLPDPTEDEKTIDVVFGLSREELDALKANTTTIHYVYQILLNQATDPNKTNLLYNDSTITSMFKRAQAQGVSEELLVKIAAIFSLQYKRPKEDEGEDIVGEIGVLFTGLGGIGDWKGPFDLKVTKLQLQIAFAKNNLKFNDFTYSMGLVTREPNPLETLEAELKNTIAQGKAEYARKQAGI